MYSCATSPFPQKIDFKKRFGGKNRDGEVNYFFAEDDQLLQKDDQQPTEVDHLSSEDDRKPTEVDHLFPEVDRKPTKVWGV